MTRSIFVVFSYGDPMPITACTTPELASAYAEALSRLPEGHALRTLDAQIDELPLLDAMPAPLLDPEHQPVTP